MTDHELRIGLISDVHACPKPLHEALRILRGEGAVEILCAGDIAGYGNKLEQTIDLLLGSNCRAVAGNHDLWYLEREGIEDGLVVDYLGALPFTVSLDIGGVRLAMVHASPPTSVMDGIRLLDEEGTLINAQREDWTAALEGFSADVLVVGHTHQVFAERLGEVLVVNPGSTVFNHTCAILTLPGMAVEFYPLSGKEPVLSWNFSMFKDAEL